MLSTSLLLCLLSAIQSTSYSVSHTPLADTLILNQSYTVKVVLQPSEGLAQPLPKGAVFEIEYVGPNGAGTSPLLAGISSNEYYAAIPAAGIPAAIKYRIKLHIPGNTKPFELLSPGSGYFHFFAGQVTTLFLNAFESAEDFDQGWTSINIGNPSYNDWQRGLPGGSFGTSFGVQWFDPPLVAGSTKFWGTDIKDTWDGAYRGNVSSYLESPNIDATQFSELHLRLRRWITLAPGDKATIELLHPSSGQTFSYPPITDVNEVAWSSMHLPIPAAFNHSTFRIRFRLNTDSGNNYGGWNLDDVEVIALSSPPIGSNTMILRGDTSISEGMQPTFRLVGGTPNTAFQLRLAVLPNWNPQGWWQNNHLFDLGPSFAIVHSGTLNAAGNAHIQLAQAAAQGHIGLTFCLEAVSQTGAVIEDSNIQFLKVWH